MLLNVLLRSYLHQSIGSAAAGAAAGAGAQGWEVPCLVKLFHIRIYRVEPPPAHGSHAEPLERG